MPPDDKPPHEVLELISLSLRHDSISSSNTADQMTAEDGKTLDKESREKPASHALLTLETLPNEIIASIAAMLTVDIDAPYVVSRPTLSTSATRKQEDANARRDLIRLCMVSKRIASNAQKALYRNVLIEMSSSPMPTP
ncbi:hypothetical protein F5883DRAFT_517083 [Diaporthe sp. PMI_573]|nr:hypothetical protein F5883DRAFT_517083 [Diaporthaceae sp. PMI_573]